MSIPSRRSSSVSSISEEKSVSAASPLPSDEVINTKRRLKLPLKTMDQFDSFNECIDSSHTAFDGSTYADFVSNFIWIVKFFSYSCRGGNTQWTSLLNHIIYVSKN